MPEFASRWIRWVTWNRRNTVLTVIAAVVMLTVAVRVVMAVTAAPGSAPLGPPGAPVQTAAARPQASSATPAPTPAAPPPAAPAPARKPPRGVNIYRWLPFTPASLASAAQVTAAFAHDYATYTATETAAAYTARMKALVTPSLAATLARGYATPGLARQRRHGQRSMTGTGRITALRAFGHSSITFLVTVVQKAAGPSGTARNSTSYAITIDRAGLGWRVNDIELASAGNT